MTSYIENNRHILYGLMLNDSFPDKFGKSDSPVLNDETVMEILASSNYPKTPEDKANNLLEYFHSLQQYEGSPIPLQGLGNNLMSTSLYFKNKGEMFFYFFTLKDMGLISFKTLDTKSGPIIQDLRLTYAGLSKVIELNESGNQSNRCFIAMSFSEDQAKTREAIKTAIRNSGFEPVLIDEQHFDSDVTINDALLAEIKKCKFMVADFTQHKHGVYFEAGFALGLKKPVIYLCEKSDFANTHFDTDHYPHLRYNNHEELIKLLQDKIDAWIS